jgi:hypothetical protein
MLHLDHHQKKIFNTTLFNIEKFLNDKSKLGYKMKLNNFKPFFRKMTQTLLLLRENLAVMTFISMVKEFTKVTSVLNIKISNFNVIEKIKDVDLTFDTIYLDMQYNHAMIKEMLQ